MSITYQWTLRDAVQSLMATRASADEIIEAIEAIPEGVFSQVQSGGGTFFDLFHLNGRKEWEEVSKLLTYFKEKGIRQSALIRGDMLVGYKRYSQKTVDEFVMEYAKLGMNVLQNFHGLNDSNLTAKVAKAVKKAQAAGYDIIAQGVICIENNPNVTIESCLAHARKLIEQGHKGFYLKSASGVVKPEFIEELMLRLHQEFPEEKMGLHIHSTYGYAEPGYIKAFKTALHSGIDLELDVQNHALSGNTAQASILDVHEMLLADPDESVRDYAAQMNVDADKFTELDQNTARLRNKYRDTELVYDKELYELLEKECVPGGELAALKSTYHEGLSPILQTTDWNTILKYITQVRSVVRKDLGYPTQVTPYAKITGDQAVQCLLNIMIGAGSGERKQEILSDLPRYLRSEEAAKVMYSQLREGTVSYLTGGIGKVSKLANKELIALAREQMKEKPKSYLREQWSKAVNALKEVGIKTPAVQQILSGVLIQNGPAHVVKCANDNNEPKDVKVPSWTYHADIPSMELLAQDVLALKRIEDGIIKFPQGHNEFRVNKIQRLRESIAEKYKALHHETILNEEELRRIQAQGMSSRFNGNYLNAMIHDVVEGKGKGLHECMMCSLRHSADIKMTRRVNGAFPVRKKHLWPASTRS
jgi:oxaloacetate decarboxylase alpha subunit